MVAWIVDIAAFPPQLLAVQTQPLIERLSPEAKLRVVLGLTLLMFLGLMIVWVVMSGARIARRYRGKPLSPTATPDENDWTHKPLTPPVEGFDEPT
jgi:hypothetical protein